MKIQDMAAFVFRDPGPQKITRARRHATAWARAAETPAKATSGQMSTSRHRAAALYNAMESQRAPTASFGEDLFSKMTIFRSSDVGDRHDQGQGDQDPHDDRARGLDGGPGGAGFFRYLTGWILKPGRAGPRSLSPRRAGRFPRCCSAWGPAAPPLQNAAGRQAERQVPARPRGRRQPDTFGPATSALSGGGQAPFRHRQEPSRSAPT